MRYSIEGLALCAAILFLSQLHVPIISASASSVSFVEIMPNPDGTDSKTNEYFKLKNYSTTIQSIEGYKVCNISNDCYLLKDGIDAGACLKIFRTDFVFSLHNDEENLSLYDSLGNLVDQVSTGTAPSGKAWLCSESFCEWSQPRDVCDYSDIVEPGANTEEEDNDNNVSPSPSSAESDSASAGKPEGTDTSINSNTNSKKSEKTVFKIASAKDWEKVKKEMNNKNLLSLLVNIRGTVSVPYNIVKSNYFYITASDKLLPVNIYASRQDEFENIEALYRNGTRIKIENGFLKYNQGSWLVGVGKDTKMKASKNPKVKSGEKAVIVTGKIIKKSGQYFYVADVSFDKQPITLYIPTVIWNKYLDKKNIGIFPRLIGNKVITATSYKDKEIKISGVKETSGNTYRILVVDENNIEISEENISDQKTSVGSGLHPAAPERRSVGREPGNSTIAESKGSSQRLEPTAGAAPTQPESAPEELSKNDNKPMDIKTTLAQKLSWRNFWNIFTTKIKILKDKLF